LAYEILGKVERSLLDQGAVKVWIATDALPDLTMMAEVPEVN
jgi:hypothetical protein